MFKTLQGLLILTFLHSIPRHVQHFPDEEQTHDPHRWVTHQYVISHAIYCYKYIFSWESIEFKSRKIAHILQTRHMLTWGMHLLEFNAIYF